VVDVSVRRTRWLGMGAPTEARGAPRAKLIATGIRQQLQGLTWTVSSRGGTPSDPVALRTHVSERSEDSSLRSE